MHFDPDGLDEESIDTLRKFVKACTVLRNHKSILKLTKKVCRQHQHHIYLYRS